MIPQEQLAERIVEQVVNVPVPQILHRIVDVPVPQIIEETVEAVSVPVPQIQEQIVEVVKALFARCAVVQQILTGFFFFTAACVTECKRMESVRDRCNGRGPWFLVLDCAPQHILLLVGAVYPICFHHDLRRNCCRCYSVHTIRPFASYELDSCSVSAVTSRQHFYRRVLHDLGQFLRSLQLSWTDLATERNLLQPRIMCWTRAHGPRCLSRHTAVVATLC